MRGVKEKLPSGFTRRSSGSIRVQIRVAGYTEVRNFSLTADTTADRRRQLAEAEAWATETRRRIVGGSHVSTREAERTTLASALERYGREGLKGEVGNAGKDRARIRVVLADPISRKTLAQLRKTDVAAFRDRLIEAGFLRNADRVARKLERSSERPTQRVTEIALLRTLVKETRTLEGDARGVLQARIDAIADSEGIKRPARSTVANVVQLVNRSLTYIAQTIDGVPDLTGVPMPPSAPGRDRRCDDGEIAALDKAAGADRLMPLLIRFAVATTLRRERVLGCRTANIRRIGSGRHTIVFPRSTTRRKRTGVVPVTREIRAIIEAALHLQGHDRIEDAPDIQIFPLSMEAFESRWKRLLSTAGIEDLHFHDLRHEGTSRLFELGLSTAEVMSITGHSTQEMVDRYSHYSASLVLEKLEKGHDEAAVLAQLSFLIDQFTASGGDKNKLQRLLAVDGMTAPHSGTHAHH